MIELFVKASRYTYRTTADVQTGTEQVERRLCQTGVCDTCDDVRVSVHVCVCVCVSVTNCVCVCVYDV